MKFYTVIEAAVAVFAMICVFLLSMNILSVGAFVKSAAQNAAGRYRRNMEALVTGSIAGVKKNEMLRVQVIAALAGLALSVLAGSAYLLIVFVPVVALAPKYYMKFRQDKYIKDYVENLPDFLESMISAVKAGMSTVNAMKEFGEKNESPVGIEMKNMISRIELGLSVKEALAELGNRVKTEENELLVTAFTTVIESGGNITEVLANILDSLRKKDEVEREMKALTSQGVMSGIIVGSLPAMLLAVIYFMDPEMVMPLFTTKTGLAMLGVAIVMEAIGAFFISKIVKAGD